MLKVISLSIILFSLQFSTVSHSALITVNNHQDLGSVDGNCDLRDAIEASNTNTSIDACAAGEEFVADVILIQTNQTIVLTDEIIITGSVTMITDLGVAPKIIMAAPDKRIFTVRVDNVSDSDISMRNLRLMGGEACCTISSGSGGAIYFDGIYMPMRSIKLDGMVFEGNSASNGGAVAFRNTFSNSVEISNSTFINNDSTSNGGALFGSGLISGSAQAFGFDMKDNLFMSNHSDGTAGAVYLADSLGITAFVTSGNVYMNNSANSKGGALLINDNNNRAYGLDAELFMYNQAAENGGALSVGLSSQVTIQNSIMLFNQAASGGAVGTTAGASLVTLKNNTLVYNAASLTGDNIYNANTQDGYLLLNNIIAEPINGDNCAGDLGTNVTQSGFNLVDDNSCEMLFNSPSLITADPQLSGFSVKTGEFPGFQPTASSPAIDSYTCNSGDFDFNGNSRPIDGDGDGDASCDRGAIEASVGFELIWSDAFGL